jgi:hypothetical protein
VGPSKYLTLDRLTQKPDRRTPLGIPLAESFLKHDRIARNTPRPGVKHVQVKWLTIKFKDMEGMLPTRGVGDAVLTGADKDKGSFVNTFDQLKKLKNIKIGMQNAVLKGARLREMGLLPQAD